MVGRHDSSRATNKIDREHAIPSLPPPPDARVALSREPVAIARGIVARTISSFRRLFYSRLIAVKSKEGTDN